METRCNGWGYALQRWVDFTVVERAKRGAGGVNGGCWACVRVLNFHKKRFEGGVKAAFPFGEYINNVLSLYKICCAQETENEFFFRSFATSSHKTCATTA
jgi:hypothetical protein